MRREIKLINEPKLTMHIEYDHLTLGEFGNILIRYQAALRSVAGLSPGEYDGRFREEKPSFVLTSVNTQHSVDINTVLAVAAIVMAAPGTMNDWSKFATDVFRRLQAVLLAMKRNKIQMPNDDDDTEDFADYNPTKDLKIRVTKGEVNIKLARPFIDNLTKKQKNAISNLIWSLTGPASKVVLTDEESEITIEWYEDKAEK